MMQYTKTFIPFWNDVQLDDKIFWGTFKGMKVHQIIEQADWWFQYACEKVANFNLSKEAFNYLLMVKGIDNGEALIILEAPAVVTKQTLRERAEAIIEAAKEKGDGLRVAEGLAVMKTLIELVRDAEEFKSLVVDELQAHSGRFVSGNGTTIQTMEAGIKYDYSYDPEWQSYQQHVDTWIEIRKEREAFLRSAKEGKEAVDTETGEVITGACKYSKTTFKVQLASK